MKAKEISTKTPNELATLAAELQAKITQARLDLSSRKSSNDKQIKSLKKDLARALTFKNQKTAAKTQKEAQSA